VRRRDLFPIGLDEDGLLAAYARLEKEGWMTGVADARGPDVIDLLERDPDRFTGRKGIPFADVLEKELAQLGRTKGSSPVVVEVARRLFSPGTSRAPYRRSLGIELINGKGDGAYFRTVESLLATASGGGWRAAVLDDAHRMTPAAENAFLKTLEEPPSGTLLILVTSEPLSLLPTTVSRCAKVVFDAVAPEVLERFLVDRQGVRVEDAPLLVRLAEGSVRRALELRGVDLAERRAFVEELLRAVAAADLGTALGVAGRRFGRDAGKERGRAGEREEARLLLELLALSLRDLVVARAAEGVAPVGGLDAATVSGLAGRLPAAAWDRLFARTETALSDVEASVEPRLAVEALFAEELTGAASR
jgi:hypothetical protein